jgi:hypothetical protein
VSLKDGAKGDDDAASIAVASRILHLILHKRNKLGVRVGILPTTIFKIDGAIKLEYKLR